MKWAFVKTALRPSPLPVGELSVTIGKERQTVNRKRLTVNTKMRVLQLIDSLRSGGAERMSVNYANALARRVNGSFLCCTRIEGLLKKHLAPEVGYLFLNRQGTLDVKAFLKLRKFVKNNKVEFIQAHGSSWFLGVFLKISLPQLKLVWHDHLGERAHGNLISSLLVESSRYFDGIITVNPQLKEWAVKNLHCKMVEYIPNFSSITEEQIKSSIKLKGKEDFKIIHLANLKQPKDHLTLLKAFQKLVRIHPTASLHLVGKDEKDTYSKELIKFLKGNDLEEKVHLYGEQDEIKSLLKQADVGVLSSSSEGLPVALLEYGLASLPVICTRVGECEGVVGGAGLVVPPQEPEAMLEALKFYLENEEERGKDSLAFHNRILEFYCEKAVIKRLLRFYQEVDTRL